MLVSGALSFVLYRKSKNQGSLDNLPNALCLARVCCVVRCTFVLLLRHIDILAMTTISNGFHQLRHFASSPTNTVPSLAGWIRINSFNSSMFDYQDHAISGRSLLSIHNGSLSEHFNTKALFTSEQIKAIQATACTLATISLVGSLTTCYWFSRMRKKFRHRLVTYGVTRLPCSC